MPALLQESSKQLPIIPASRADWLTVLLGRCSCFYATRRKDKGMRRDLKKKKKEKKRKKKEKNNDKVSSLSHTLMFKVSLTEECLRCEILTHTDRGRF